MKLWSAGIEITNLIARNSLGDTGGTPRSDCRECEKGLHDDDVELSQDCPTGPSRERKPTNALGLIGRTGAHGVHALPMKPCVFSHCSSGWTPDAPTVGACGILFALPRRGLAAATSGSEFFAGRTRAGVCRQIKAPPAQRSSYRARQVFFFE